MNIAQMDDATKRLLIADMNDILGIRPLRQRNQMIRFHTLNSTYEIDTANKLFRRVTGTSPPRSVLPADGEWAPYALAERVEVGSRALIVFTTKLDRSLLTSEITRVEECPSPQPSGSPSPNLQTLAYTE